MDISFDLNDSKYLQNIGFFNVALLRISSRMKLTVTIEVAVVWIHSPANLNEPWRKRCSHFDSSFVTGNGMNGRQSICKKLDFSILRLSAFLLAYDYLGRRGLDTFTSQFE